MTIATVPSPAAEAPLSSADASGQTTPEIVRGHAQLRPEAPALCGSEGAVVSYAALLRHIETVGDTLRDAGIGAGDWVAVVLPDTMDLALTVVALTGCATALPLSSDLAAVELDALFASDKMKAVIVATIDAPAAVSARKCGLAVFLVSRSPNGLSLSLQVRTLTHRSRDRAIGPDTIAFVLRTSGTTARPKLVAVTHRNLVATAIAVQEWFALTADDRALCALPLYYSFALKVGLFTTILSGGSVICGAPTAGGGLLDWLERFAPSWYSASPAVHCAILEQARARKRPLRHALRFIHSGAAPLPDAVHDGLEAVFSAPVLQTYGLSEVGLIAANGFAAAGRKRGTVGKCRPGELACRDQEGRILPAGALGEIVVRGPGVMPGYINDSEANAAAFALGWFRTGDIGRIDRDGFVTIIGRLKEIINRGGEKIAPSEIDEALLRHPAVAEAAAFPIPHPRLGEDVAAAVVFRSGKVATALELRRFLRNALEPYKIPRRIKILSSLPRNASGKVKRLDLAESIPPTAAAAAASWASPLEVQIAEIWRRLLRIDDLTREDDFFEKGGDSLLEAQMLLELEQITGRTLPEDLLFEAATIPQLAESIVRSDTSSAEHLLVKVQPGNGRPPFIFVDGDFWGGGYYTRKIARLLGPDHPFYDLRSHGLRGERIPPLEAMAGDYLALVRAAQPHGPYRIAGHCNGALAALALASKLEAIGERVELVVLIEPITLNARPAFRLLARLLDGALRLTAVDAARRREHIGAAMSLAWRAVRKANRWYRHGKEIPLGDTLDMLNRRIQRFDAAAAVRYAGLQDQYRRAMAGFLPVSIKGEILCIVAEAHEDDIAFSARACRRLAARCETAVIPGEHMTCITTHAEELTGLIRDRLRALDSERGEPRAQGATASA